MADFMIRVGDQDDYNREDMDGVIDTLRAFEVKGPLTPYASSSAWAGSMRGKIVGVEAEGYRGNNYISLYVPEDDSIEFSRSFTDEELAEINRRLQES